MGFLDVITLFMVVLSGVLSSRWVRQLGIRRLVINQAVFLTKPVTVKFRGRPASFLRRGRGQFGSWD